MTMNESISSLLRKLTRWLDVLEAAIQDAKGSAVLFQLEIEDCLVVVQHCILHLLAPIQWVLATLDLPTHNSSL